MRLLSHAIRDYGVTCMQVLGTLRWSATLAVFSPFSRGGIHLDCERHSPQRICAYAPPFLSNWASGSTADAPGL